MYPPVKLTIDRLSVSKNDRFIYFHHIFFAFFLLSLYTIKGMIIHCHAEVHTSHFLFMKRGSTHEYDTRRTLRKNS